MQSFTNYLMSTCYTPGAGLALEMKVYKKFGKLTSWKDANKTIGTKALYTL